VWGWRAKMSKLTASSKVLILLIGGGALAAAVYTRSRPASPPGATGPGGSAAVAPGGSGAAPAGPGQPRRPGEIIVALSEWPGHMALVVGNGGLTTQPGSAAAGAGLDLSIVFIEDAAKKNQALAEGKVDFVWQTVDEMPINMAIYRDAKVDVRALVQIDWSRGGDACIASHEVKRVEDILGRRSAMMMFSPDHTVFEFMITNSRFTPAEIAQVRKDTMFSPDDFTYGRRLFVEGKVDVACLWEPDVTLALAGRPGSHRLFSTADATELVADVLLGRKSDLDSNPEMARQVAKVWFAGVRQANADRLSAGRFIASVVPRFRDELGPEKTTAALDWVRFTDLSDNVRFFGLDGSSPAFDRVYNQADSIWITYPQAKIEDRFAPSTLRDDRVVRKLWEEAGRPPVARGLRYEPRVAEKGRPLFTKPLSIQFPSRGWELDAQAMSVLNREVVPQLEIARGMYVRVEGNTDSVGPDGLNVKLSERRAEAIVEYLIGRGVDRARIFARGNGSWRPVASNKTPGGRARNRRTDILFIPAARASR
jgi:outer membrane protein OmpA-like peptidoglycan-associated protein/ABC-type nitrate/sulfonate/bicarbonate transport system substrate-binding protein